MTVVSSGLSSIPDHNKTKNIQGGNELERYHLTQDQLNVVSNTSGVNTGDQDLSNLATKTLNNLGTTAVNADILPYASLLRSLGSLAKRWLAIWTDKIYFVGTGNGLHVNLTANPDTAEYEISLPLLPPTGGYFLKASSSGNPSLLEWAIPNFGANLTLSNLTGSSVNVSLSPVGPGTLDIGSNTRHWKDAYLTKIVFKGTYNTTLSRSSTTPTRQLDFKLPSTMASATNVLSFLDNSGQMGYTEVQAAGSGALIKETGATINDATLNNPILSGASFDYPTFTYGNLIDCAFSGVYNTWMDLTNSYSTVMSKATDVIIPASQATPYLFFSYVDVYSPAFKIDYALKDTVTGDIRMGVISVVVNEQTGVPVMTDNVSVNSGLSTPTISVGVDETLGLSLYIINDVENDLQFSAFTTSIA